MEIQPKTKGEELAKRLEEALEKKDEKKVNWTYSNIFGEGLQAVIEQDRIAIGNIRSNLASLSTHPAYDELWSNMHLEKARTALLGFISTLMSIEQTLPYKTFIDSINKSPEQKALLFYFVKRPYRTELRDDLIKACGWPKRTVVKAINDLVLADALREEVFGKNHWIKMGRDGKTFATIFRLDMERAELREMDKEQIKNIDTDHNIRQQKVDDEWNAIIAKAKEETKNV